MSEQNKDKRSGWKPQHSSAQQQYNRSYPASKRGPGPGTPGVPPGMRKTFIRKQWSALQEGDVLVRPEDGREFQVMKGFSPDQDSVMLLPLSGQPRMRCPRSTVQSWKLPEVEVLVPIEKPPVQEQAPSPQQQKNRKQEQNHGQG